MISHSVRALAAGLLVSTAGMAGAQSVADCDWQASAAAIAEPWEENTATFANGRVRIAALDTIEPATGFAWLLILSPPFDELGARQCKVVGAADGIGFAGIFFDTLEASYDPTTGLTILVQVWRYDPARDGFGRQDLGLLLNQRTGEITADVGAILP